MTLELLPDFRDTVIVVGTSARKSLPILKAYLQSLDDQQLPPRVKLVPCFVPDFTPAQQDADQYLRDWVKFRNGKILRGAPSQQGDFADSGFDSHQWSPTAMARVGYNKNQIIQFALQSKADYLLLADADLILDRTTVASLLSCEKPITTAVYWTKWSKRETETRKLAAQPQCWLRQPYLLDGRGMDEAEFRSSLVARRLTRVWGFGALTLINRKVLEAGVDFSYLPDVTREGMMAGEDRHFSIRAERLHIDAWADGWPDIFHVYHDEDVLKIPQMAERLGREHPTRAVVGDLVSLRLRALEPLPVGPNRFQSIAPQLVRGRLGALALSPEIESAILSMNRGDVQTVRCQHPPHHPLPFLRGRTRLYEVTLIDVKPASSVQPVLEDELHVLAGGKSVDMALLNDGQLESMAEAVNA